MRLVVFFALAVAIVGAGPTRALAEATFHELDAQKLRDVPVTRFEGSAGLALSFDKGGTCFLTAGKTSARIWDARSLKPLTPSLTHDKRKNINLAALSPDGGKVLTVCGEEVQLWASIDGKRGAVLRHAGRVRFADFSPDSSKVVTAGDDDVAVIWDAITGDELLRIPHSGPVYFAAFSPGDGSRLLTLSMGDVGYKTANQAAIIWNAITGKELNQLARVRAIVNGIFAIV